MAMETKVMTITPEMARTMLAQNMTGNRPVQKETVHNYARQMKYGKWNLTHQGIAFDEDGKLIDGQHRLSAIVEANMPVQMNVTYGVTRTPGQVFTIDMGRKRTYKNVVHISGIDDPVYRCTGAYVSAYIRYKMCGGHKADPAEIVDYIERHYDDVKKLYMYTGGASSSKGSRDGWSRIPAIVGAAMLAAIYRGESADALYKFSQVYMYNDVRDCNAYNAKFVLNLRDYVKQQKGTTDVYIRCESAIWAFSHNLSCLRQRDNCYPFNQSLDA